MAKAFLVMLPKKGNLLLSMNNLDNQFYDNNKNNELIFERRQDGSDTSATY